ITTTTSKHNLINLDSRNPEIREPCSRKRFIGKDGSGSVIFRHVPEEWMLMVTDIFTTLVEIRWRVMFLLFALSYILSWLFFGLLFWVIAIVNGDVQNPNSDPCVYEVRSFTAAFLFSLETQTTIGYGFRGMTENCMVAVIIVTIQDVISYFIDTFVIGIVVAKMASARKRAQTVGFSHCAVVNLRNGALSLSWRVGDFRRHHLVEGEARAQIIRSMVHPTGRLDITYQDLVLEQKDVILATPTIITHRMAPKSPLYGLSLAQLRSENFELVVSFTYTDDTSGILHQTRSSYTPNDIHWGSCSRRWSASTGRRTAWTTGCSAPPPRYVTTTTACSAPPPRYVTTTTGCSAPPPRYVTTTTACSAPPPRYVTTTTGCSAPPPRYVTTTTGCSAPPPRYVTTTTRTTTTARVKKLQAKHVASV
uniref:Potassium inwardly rectifying channel subfamily J member 16 n=1 Tax=Neogobius melanostomus TaxID=47308 RepID=A0A8C6TXP3_9GOBI